MLFTVSDSVLTQLNAGITTLKSTILPPQQIQRIGGIDFPEEMEFCQ